MCNLYTLTRTVDEVARSFNALVDPPGNAVDTVYPGYPGYVVAEGRVRQMTWGFPLAMRGKSGQLLKPKLVNNIADLQKPMWIGFACKPQWRCLIH